MYCDPKQRGVITFWFQINTSGAKYLLTVKGTEEKSNADKDKYRYVVTIIITLDVSANST